MLTLTQFNESIEESLFRITWEITDLLKEYKITESKTYKGQLQLCQDIAKDLIKRNKECRLIINSNQLNNYENIFFDKLIINYSSKEIDHYDNIFSESDKDFVKENYKLKQLSIGLKFITNTQYRTLLRKLLHETLHAFQDLKMFISKHPSSLSIKTQEKFYKKSLKFINDKDYIKTFVANLSYQNSKIELNAFLSELEADTVKDLNNNKPKFNSYKDAFNYFANNDTYNQYKLQYFLFNDIENGNQNDIKEKIVKLYNEIYKTNFTWENIYKKYYKTIRNNWIKTCSTIANIYNDYVEQKLKDNIDEQLIDNSKMINIPFYNRGIEEMQILINHKSIFIA